jgi:hypothetical protein
MFFTRGFIYVITPSINWITIIINYAKTNNKTLDRFANNPI